VSMTPLLELRHVNKRFGAVQALDDVALTVRAGEVTALVGDNGAGKSTLIKCIGGIHAMDSGAYLIGGEAVTVRTPREAASLGVEVVYQDLALCNNLDAVQNMFLGREIRRHGLLDEAAMEKVAAVTLRRMAATTVASMRRPVSMLSGGQRQTVAIARAILGDSRIIVLDEPTAALGVIQTTRVLELVRQLADSGLAVILISHNMNDVFAVADSIAALYLGRLAVQVRASLITYSQLIEVITTGTCETINAVPPIAGTRRTVPAQRSPVVSARLQRRASSR
jgi:D-xylose transport system ATP-binding protein